MKHYDPLTRWIVKHTRSAKNAVVHTLFPHKALDSENPLTHSFMKGVCGFGVIQKSVLLSDWKKAKQMVLLKRFSHGNTYIQRQNRLEDLQVKIQHARNCLQHKTALRDANRAIFDDEELRHEREQIDTLEAELHKLHEEADRPSRLKRMRSCIWDCIRGRTRRKVNQRVWTDLNAQDREYVKALILDFGYALSLYNVTATRLERTLIVMGTIFGLDIEIQATPTFLQVSFHDCFTEQITRSFAKADVKVSDLSALEQKILTLLGAVQNAKEAEDQPVASLHEASLESARHASNSSDCSRFFNVDEGTQSLSVTHGSANVCTNNSNSPLSLSSQESRVPTSVSTSYSALLRTLDIEDQLEEILEDTDSHELDSSKQLSCGDTPRIHESTLTRKNFEKSAVSITPVREVSPKTFHRQSESLSATTKVLTPLSGITAFPSNVQRQQFPTHTPTYESEDQDDSSSVFSMDIGDGEDSAPVVLHPNSPRVDVDSKYAHSNKTDPIESVHDEALLPSENYLVRNTTHFVNIPSQNMHLTKLIYLEALAEQIQSGDVPVGSARTELRLILKRVFWMETYGMPYLARLVGAPAIATLLHGNRIEILASLTAAVIIVLLQICTTWSQALQSELAEVASLIGGLVALGFKIWFRNSDYSVNTILVALSNMVGFLAGFAITQAFSELSDRKIQSGILRLMGAVIKIFKLSFGVLIANSLERIFFQDQAVLDSEHTNPPWAYALAVVGAIFTYCINFRAPFFVLSTLLSLMAGFVGFFGTNYLRKYIGMELATLLGAVAVGLFGEVYARITSHPSTVVSSVSLLLLVPGSLPVRSQIALLIVNDASVAMQLLFQTGVIAVALILGLTISKMIMPSHRILEY